MLGSLPNEYSIRDFRGRTLEKRFIILGLFYARILYMIAIMPVYDIPPFHRTRTIKFGKERISLIENELGDWVDDHGTIYPKELMDEGFCGLEGIYESGEWDPYHAKACYPHDRAFARMKLGYRSPAVSNKTVFADFAKESTLVMLKGLYAVGMYLPYMLFGGVGGILRWAQLENTRGK